MAKDPNESRMTFGEHLEELRTRIWRSLGLLLVGVILVWNFKERLLGWLLRPLEVAWYCKAHTCTNTQVFSWMIHVSEFERIRPAAGAGALPSLHFAHPTDAFSAYLQLSIIGGLILTLPYSFWQVWGFVAPGLYTNEKKYVFPIVASSTAFFLLGALFGYYIVFPFGYQWFLDFGGPIAGTGTTIQPTLMMLEYLDFTSMMLLAFGVVFEMPLFVFFLALTGVVTGRQLLGFGRYFIVLAFILAAVLTPSTDMYSQVMLGLPLVVLYYLAALLALVFGPKEARGFRAGASSKRDEEEKTAKDEKTLAREKEQKLIEAKIAAAKVGARAPARPARQGYVAGRSGLYDNRNNVVAAKEKLLAQQKGGGKPGFKPTAGKP